MSRFSSYKEELEVKKVFDSNIYATKDGMKKYIENFDDSDLDKFVIVKGELLYVGNDDQELEVADRLGIGNIKSEGGKEIVEEVQNIVDYLGNIDEEKIPQIDELIANGESLDEVNGYIGAPLISRTEETVANGTWDIVDSYTSDNQLDKRYETGYFFLDNTKTYKMNGKELSFVNPAIIDYSERNFIILGDNMERWNKSSTLSGSSEGLVYNFDATMSPEKTVKSEETILNEEVYHPVLNGKTQDDVYWIGDVKTNGSRTALMLNCSEDNPTKEGGFVSVKVDDMDLTNGMTFLFLGKLKEGYRANQLNRRFEEPNNYVAILQITSDSMDEFPKGRIILRSGGWRGDLCNKGDLSSYKGLKYRVEDTGDFFTSDRSAEKVTLNTFLSIMGSYRLNLCEDDKELCESEGLDYNTCSEFSFNAGNGFEHYIGVSEFYRQNWSNINNGWLEIGMVSSGLADNRHYLSGEFYVVRVYQKSMTDEEMEEEISKATRYVNSFVETN